MPSDEIDRLYKVADDGEADMLDQLRERAGIIWTHYACWTNMVDDGQTCENCGKSYAELRQEFDCSEVGAWENVDA